MEDTCKNCKHTILADAPAGETWFICRNQESPDYDQEVDASWYCEKWEGKK